MPMIESMIFFPEKTLYEKPEDYGFKHEDVFLKTGDGVTLHGWYLHAPQAKPEGVILFFHGNAGNISNRLYKMKGWLERGFSALLIDYRGYGKSEGAIRHSDDVLKDADAALRWLTDSRKTPLSEIIVYGESLGTYPAIRLTCDHKVRAVILEAPFTSLFDVARTHYPFVLRAMMQQFQFSNIEHIQNLKAPLFILHGNEDEICPYAMAGELFEKAPEPKGFLSIPNGRHNDLPMIAGEDYFEKPYEFIVKNAKR